MFLFSFSKTEGTLRFLKIMRFGKKQYLRAHIKEKINKCFITPLKALSNYMIVYVVKPTYKFVRL